MKLESAEKAATDSLQKKIKTKVADNSRHVNNLPKLPGLVIVMQYYKYQEEGSVMNSLVDLR